MASQPEHPQQIYEKTKAMLMKLNSTHNESIYDLITDTVTCLQNPKKSKIYENFDGSLNVENLIRNVREDQLQLGNRAATTQVASSNKVRKQICPD